MKNFHNCRFSAIKLTVTVCLFAAFFISNDIKAEVLYQDIQDPTEEGVEGLKGINTKQDSDNDYDNIKVTGVSEKQLNEILGLNNRHKPYTRYALPKDFGKSKYDKEITSTDWLNHLETLRGEKEQENLKNWLLGSGIVIFIFFIVIIVIKYISNKTEKATRESPKSKVIVEKPQIEKAPKPNKNDAPKGTEKDSKEKIIEDLQILSNAIQEDNIELAKEKIEQIRNAIKNTNVEEDLAKSIDTIEANYRNGISDPFEFSYVDYTYPAHFIQGDNWDYAVAKFPSKGTFVFPYRRRKIERRGYMEDSFQSYLENKLSKSNLLVLGDCAILPADNILPYEPDIAIIDNEHPSLRIDIEIDEPYAAITNKPEPIHYIGCGDDFRDMNLNNLGWIVVRFTEFQVYSDMPGCASFVAQLIHSLNPSKPLPESLLTQNFPQTQKRWRENEAKVMAAEKVREKYLNHEFGISEPNGIIDADIKQNDKEKAATKLVQPLKFPTPKPQKPKPTPKLNKPESKSSVIDERDKHIQFLPQEHIYLYNGREQLTPVSSVVSCFFNRFDSYYRSECQAKQRGVPQGLVLEEWDSIGERSREVGTFMHQQIENHYNGLPYQQTFSFRYKGKYIHLEEEISLELEYMQFTEFLKNHRFSPFRTEWAIYDEKLKIAGTIDMIHKREDVFDIYDWKRSYRIVDFSGNPIAENSYGKKGLGVLNQIDDTPYWHYCIQQNLYRYILEQNYGIRIEKMYLVVFGDNITEYCKLDVPRMDKTIDSMVKSLRKS